MQKPGLFVVEITAAISWSHAGVNELSLQDRDSENSLILAVLPRHCII